MYGPLGVLFIVLCIFISFSYHRLSLFFCKVSFNRSLVSQVIFKKGWRLIRKNQEKTNSLLIAFCQISLEIISRSKVLTILSSFQKSKDRFKVQRLSDSLLFSKIKRSFQGPTPKWFSPLFKNQKIVWRSNALTILSAFRISLKHCFKVQFLKRLLFTNKINLSKNIKSMLHTNF